MQDFYNVSEIQISYSPQFKATDRPKISQSEDAYEIFFQSYDPNLIAFQEQAKMMLLNANSRVLGLVNLSAGSMTETAMDPRIIFATALKAAATSIVLAHNHPTGSLKASHQDELCTKVIAEAGKLLRVNLLDHLIITPEQGRYYSFADHCKL